MHPTLSSSNAKGPLSLFAKHPCAMSRLSIPIELVEYIFEFVVSQELRTIKLSIRNLRELFKKPILQGLLEKMITTNALQITCKDFYLTVYTIFAKCLVNHIQLAIPIDDLFYLNLIKGKKNTSNQANLKALKENAYNKALSVIDTFEITEGSERTDEDFFEHYSSLVKNTRSLKININEKPYYFLEKIRTHSLRFSSLESLEIKGDSLSSLEEKKSILMSKFFDSSNLKTLHLYKLQISEEALKNRFFLKNLERIYLSHCQLVAAEEYKPSKSSNVKSLILIDVDLDKLESLTNICKDMEKLETLIVIDTSAIKTRWFDISYLSESQSLISIGIVNFDFYSRILKDKKMYYRIKIIFFLADIVFHEKFNDILTYFPNLETLKITNTSNSYNLTYRDFCNKVREISNDLSKIVFIEKQNGNFIKHNKFLSDVFNMNLSQ